ncbi:uncharacterized protein LOC134252808 isoform X2 [Saccostrea cucullata]|uniref:uncharacterized protein LOC134252808 isoform X2 n=1 Tax=Saccostrea cuccullata TaxID=36930 RepID=UPI002ED40737
MEVLIRLKEFFIPALISCIIIICFHLEKKYVQLYDMILENKRLLSSMTLLAESDNTTQEIMKIVAEFKNNMQKIEGKFNELEKQMKQRSEPLDYNESQDTEETLSWWMWITWKLIYMAGVFMIIVNIYI